MGEQSWAIKAIEREAMSRATALLAYPQTFSFMGLQTTQLTWLIFDYEARTGKSARDLDPAAPRAVAYQPEHVAGL